MITIHVDDGSGRSFSGNPPITIGRGAECQVQLNDEAASRRHLVISREGRDVVAIDQDSRNGTFLRGPDSRIKRAILRSGDLLIVGRTRLRVDIAEDDVGAAIPTIRFHLLSPPAAARVVEVDKESITLGRHPTCDVVLPDPTVSRRHAMVVRTPGGFVINDQNSVNAVLAGNPPVRVTSALLRDGDEIQLGTARLRVEISGEAAPLELEEPLPEPTGFLQLLEVPHPPRAVLQPHLARTPLFRGFRQDDWEAFFAAYERDRAITVRRFAAGGAISEAGKFDLAFCLVLSGCADVYAAGPTAGKGPLGQLGPGDFFGLIEAKRALPRASTMIAAAEVHLLYVPRHYVRFIEHNAAARALLAARYKEEAWRVMAAQLDLFAGVDPRVASELIERSEILFYDKAGIVIVEQGASGDSFYVVRDGFVRVVQRRDDGTDRVLAYLRPGEFFGEMALLDDVPRQASVLTAGKAELVRISRADFRELCARNPEVERQVRALTAKRRVAGQQMTPELSARLERWGQGYLQADALLVMDLELCVKCDLCVTACETLHGESRLVRSGMQLGKYLVPSACRHCDDPLCMFACPTGAVNRRPEGEIFIQYDACVGCGACAIACPYDNITMIETGKFDQAQARKQRILPDQQFFRPLPVVAPPREAGWRARLSRRGKTTVPAPAASAHDEQTHAVPPRYPIKCDLCDGLPFMGCVHACPTGAAIRLDPRTIFDETGAVSVGSRINKATGSR